MARKPTGAVVEHTARDGRTYRSLRFTAYGKRRFESLGPVSEGEAQRALRHVLADVERGTWQPAQAVETPPAPEPVPTFHQYAETFWLLNHDRWAARTVEGYKWRLERKGGLIDYFGEMPVDKITVDTVERFIAARLAEEPTLSARSINMMVILLSMILEGAEERGLVVSNPARGRRRRVVERRPQRAYLDSAEAIQSVLDAADRMDADARRDVQHIHRRAIVATLLFAGLRITELCELRWGDVDLAGGWLSVQSAKTDAGIRRIRIRGILRDTLLAIKPNDATPDKFVFGTSNGGRTYPSNIRNRILAPAVRDASRALVERGGVPLPHLTPHGCRRTFCSVAYALGESPATVMSEMGHTSPQMALSAYAQAMRRDERENARLKALVEGVQLAVIGSRADIADSDLVEHGAG